MAIVFIIGLAIVASYIIELLRLYLYRLRGHARFKTVTTQAVYLVSPDGKPRGWFSTDKEHGVFLALYDKDGQFSRLRLKVGADGEPAIFLSDKNGYPHIDLSIDAEGAATLRLYGPAREAFVMAGAFENGVTGYWISRKSDEAKPSVLLSLNEEGDPSLRFRSQTGSDLISLNASSEGSSLWFSDKDETERIALGVTKKQLAGMWFFDGNGKRRVEVTASRRTNPNIRMTTSSGILIWSPPQKNDDDAK